MTHTISTTSASLVTLSGTIDNPTTITGTGLLSGGLYAAFLNGSDWTITNSGIVQGAGVSLVSAGTVVNTNSIVADSTTATGVFLEAGGRVTNKSGGTISGLDGIYGGTLSSAMTVVNFGSVVGNQSGVLLFAGGSVTNQSGGRINGAVGIAARNSAATVVNVGRIAGGAISTEYGIGLFAGGRVTNQSGGSISAGYTGIYGAGSAVTVVNAGTISVNKIHPTAYGIDLHKGGRVTNQSGGTISGHDGIYFKGGASTVENGGSIYGTNFAVYLAKGFNDRLVIDPGAVFSGNIYSGNTLGAAHVSTLELASGSSAGTLTNFSSYYVNFAQVTIDSGASWTLAGPSTLVTHVTLTDSGTLTNVGSIGGTGITLAANGVLSNASAGIINNASGIAVTGSGGAGTVVNAGSIGGSTFAVQLAAYYANRVVIDPGAIFSGKVDGGNTLSSSIASSTLELAGTSAATLTSFGSHFIDFAQVVIDNGAIWTLASSTNTFASGVTVTNSGSIAGAGVTLSGAVLNNAAGGGITGSSGIAVNATGGAITVVNAGAITESATGFSGRGINLAAGGRVTNQSGGTISGYHAIFGAGSAVTVVNTGAIAGYMFNFEGRGIHLTAGGKVTNQSGGTISGYLAVYGSGSSVAVVNAGRIAGSTGLPQGQGVDLFSGGSVTNQSGGTITAYEIGVHGAGTVVNYGSIAGHNATIGYGYGVDLPAGGRLTNQSGGAISGHTGIFVEGVATLVNAGSIAGNTTAANGIGVKLNGGSLTNQSGGTISGHEGIYDQSGALTVVNAGSIGGATLAVAFAYGSANRLVIDPGAVFSGTVNGGNNVGAAHVSTLELASSGSAGTLSGFGSQYLNFAQITIDSGASWTLAGSNTIASGVTLSDSGALALIGTLTNRGSLISPITMRAGSYLDNLGTIFGSGVAAVLAPASGSVTVTNAGLIDPATYGVELRNGGLFSNLSGGTVIGATDGVYVKGGAGTVVTAGSISGGTDAVKFAAGHTNLLVADPGATFSGVVDGGNTIGATLVSTLELASGASVGTLSGLGTQFVNFAQTTVDANAAWTLTGNNTIVSGAALTAQTGAVLTDTGTLVNNGGIVLNPSVLTVAGLIGSGSVTIGSHSTLESQGTIASSETIRFGGNSAYLHLDNPGSVAGSVTNFDVGETIDLKGVSAGSVGFSGGTLSFAGGSFPLALAGAGPVTAAPSADGADVTVACFLRGTPILTDRGEMPVEELAIGDLAITLSGDAKLIKWIGRRSYGARFVAANRDLLPIRIAANALADGVPSYDLDVSPKHAMYIDGVLVPAEKLVNGVSIYRVDTVQDVEYFHLELAAHDVIYAAGAPSETFVDCDNRGMFQNAAEYAALYPDERARWAFCAPRIEDGEALARVRRGLERRLALCGHVTTFDPELRLLVDGDELAPESVSGRRYRFRLRQQPTEVRMLSRVSIPAEVQASTDTRRLGVSVARLVLSGDGASVNVGHRHPLLIDGFHAAEATHRWTDGSARVPPELFAAFPNGVAVEVLLRDRAMPYRCDPRLREAMAVRHPIQLAAVVGQGRV